VPKPENNEIYKKYKALADATAHTHFVGRLATYKYYNMDQVVAQALTLYNRISKAQVATELVETSLKAISVSVQEIDRALAVTSLNNYATANGNGKHNGALDAK